LNLKYLKEIKKMGKNILLSQLISSNDMRISSNVRKEDLIG
jgi:hypothetical protein